MAKGLMRLAVAGLILVGGAALAEPEKDGGATKPGVKDAGRVSVTTGKVRTATRGELTYTATAGYMPIKDEQEKLRANIFYTSYVLGEARAEEGGVATTRASATATVVDAPGASTQHAEKQRPVTFVFNGGPGAASAWLHLGTAGPVRIEMPADGTPPKPPFKLVANEQTWLPATDMVCVDPVNTGFSRAVSDEEAKKFFGVQEDIGAMGEFIRLWLSKNGRWGAPVYLAGESYGTTRAAGLSDHLQQRVGVSVSGIVLISTVLNFATLSPGENNDLPFALYLPSYAATAWYHGQAGKGKKLEEFLKEAEGFALGEYLVGLGRGAGLGAEEKGKLAVRLAEFTGLRREYVVEANLRVAPARFEKELLRSRTGEGSKIVGRFDGRLTGFPTDATGDSQEYDPSLQGFLTAYTSAMNEYVRRTLKFESDLPYEVLSGRTQPWNYGSGGWNGYLYVGDNLRDAMTHNPSLRVLVCSGRFDLATPYFATDYTVGHMGISAEARKNIATKYYGGGHMMYHVKEELGRLGGDVMGFIEGR